MVRNATLYQLPPLSGTNRVQRQRHVVLLVLWAIGHAAQAAEATSASAVRLAVTLATSTDTLLPFLSGLLLLSLPALFSTICAAPTPPFANYRVR